MQSLPGNLYLASQVREFDRRAIKQHAIPGYTLMCRAGTAAFRLLDETWPDAQRIVVVCGAGNNAGDALVIATLAIAADRQVRVMMLRPGNLLQGDAATAWQDYLAAGGTADDYTDSGLDGADLIVDGILGTGLDREVSGDFAAAIVAINEQRCPVVALDIPSGLSADSGQPLGVAVKATSTISFVALKAGLFLGQGSEYCGEIFFDNLNVPDGVYAGAEPRVRLLKRDEIRELLPPRRKTAHKGDFGHLLIVGGGPGMPGAVCLAGEAALRSGAGLVSVATHPDHLDYFAARPELMCHGVDRADHVLAMADKADVIALGPGLGQSEWADQIWRAATAIELPMVIDADGLNWLARNPIRRDDWILTPHPGEAARLLGIDNKAVQMDRLAAVRSVQEKYGGIVILKGAGTLVQDESEVPALCRYGNPGMAAPGMGDVLTGLVGGLLAQTGDLYRSARSGVLIHALAGDQAASEGERGVVAGDLMYWIRQWVNPKA